MALEMAGHVEPGAIITATSTRGPLTAAKAAPELIPKTDTGPDRAGQFEVVGGCSKRERGRVRVVRAHRLRQRREPGMPGMARAAGGIFR